MGPRVLNFRLHGSREYDVRLRQHADLLHDNLCIAGRDCSAMMALMTPIAGTAAPVYTPTTLNVPNGTPAATAPVGTAPPSPRCRGAAPIQTVPSPPGAGQAIEVLRQAPLHPSRRPRAAPDKLGTTPHRRCQVAFEHH